MRLHLLRLNGKKSAFWVFAVRVHSVSYFRQGSFYFLLSSSHSFLFFPSFSFFSPHFCALLLILCQHKVVSVRNGKLSGSGEAFFLLYRHRG